MDYMITLKNDIKSKMSFLYIDKLEYTTDFDICIIFGIIEDGKIYTVTINLNSCNAIQDDLIKVELYNTSITIIRKEVAVFKYMFRLYGGLYKSIEDALNLYILSTNNDIDYSYIKNKYADKIVLRFTAFTITRVISQEYFNNSKEALELGISYEEFCKGVDKNFEMLYKTKI